MAMSNGRDMTRAEIFEDEKRRIIDSCFSKADENGISKPAGRPFIASWRTGVCRRRSG
jgi:hypothetical protein